MRRVPALRAILALRTALQDWLLAIVSKCMFILPLVDFILKRG
jgi:predicted component of type VI protein secretion system